jgi:hypothetical protein
MASPLEAPESRPLAALISVRKDVPTTTTLTNRRNNSPSNISNAIATDADLILSTQRKNKFTAWKRKKDSKIVGLKHYGLESPRHQLHNALSNEDGCSGSNSFESTSYHGPHSKQHRKYHTSLSTRSKLFAVEKEEDVVRKQETKNPLILFYLGNIAAMKVLIYYFSKLVSQIARMVPIYRYYNLRYLTYFCSDDPFFRVLRFLFI